MTCRQPGSLEFINELLPDVFVLRNVSHKLSPNVTTSCIFFDSDDSRFLPKPPWYARNILQ